MLKEISLEIIRKCPNHCLHCSSLSGPYCTEILPYKMFESVIIDAAKLGAKTICLSGGEPFLHPDIERMAHTVRIHGLNCYIYTSGITLDPSGKAIALPIELLTAISHNVTKLIFNLEAATEDTYNLIMGTQSYFSKMMESITASVAMGIHAEAHFVPMLLNYKEIPDVIALCNKLQISQLSFLRLVLHGRAAQNKAKIALDAENYKKLKHQLAMLQSQTSLVLRLGVPLSFETTCCKCEAAKGKLNIRYDGKVFPCEVFKNNSIQAALNGLQPDSIYDKSLFDIYQTSEYLQQVRTLSDSFSELDIGETCVGQYLINQEWGAF